MPQRRKKLANRLGETLPRNDKREFWAHRTAECSGWILAALWWDREISKWNVDWETYNGNPKPLDLRVAPKCVAERARICQAQCNPCRWQWVTWLNLSGYVTRAHCALQLYTHLQHTTASNTHTQHTLVQIPNRASLYYVADILHSLRNGTIARKCFMWNFLPIFGFSVLVLYLSGF